MPEIKIFVDVSEKATKTVVICPSNAEKLGVSNGGMVEVFNPDNGQKVAALVEISDLVLDFAGQVFR